MDQILGPKPMFQECQGLNINQSQKQYLHTQYLRDGTFADTII